MRFSPVFRKIALSVALIAVAFCIVALVACSTSKGAKKTKPAAPASANPLVSSGPEEVKKKLGEPSEISRTPENHILWVYEPSWKIMPDDKGTVYVEFKDGKVIKVFSIK
jgi:hypothetical protein